MKEQGFDRHFGTSAPPAQPHFDDDWALLSARPVVPLEKIEAKARHRRRWFLGAAFALAMMLGAASALLASYLKLRNVPADVSEISEVETPAPEAPVAVTDSVTSSVSGQLPLVENGGEISGIRELMTPVTPGKPKRQTPVRNSSSEMTRPRVVHEEDEADELNRIREAILYDQWQERRARRAARRERRNRVDHHDRDLSNLDEIFEGPRRRPY